MRKFSLLRSLALPIPLLLISLNQCEDIKEGCEVKEFYISPNFSEYKIETVALLPMAYDDTTDDGTFYSTNHFYNKLLEMNRYNFVDIDKFTASDSSDIAALLKSIKDSLKINLDSLYSTSLGKFLKSQNCDAIIIGNVFDYNKYYFTNTRYGLFYRFYFLTESNFNYFMVSLKDGKILWAANVDGKAYYEFYDNWFSVKIIYPPLDVAISNGIDALLVKLKKETFLESKVN